MNNLLSPLFSSWLNFSSDTHTHETSLSSHVNFHKSLYRTNLYGKNSIIVSAI